jgi:hypothetical protein
VARSRSYDHFNNSALRRPVEPNQYTSIDYTQTLDDHLVLASIGTVGDGLDNALTESFVDSYKTELIADRVSRSRAQLELATVEWVSRFNHDRLHESLGDIPRVELEQLHASDNPPASNGNTPTALAQPPMEMTSYGQTPPATSNEPLLGLPTGLGQPTNGSPGPTAPRVAHFPTGGLLPGPEPKDSDSITSTTKDCSSRRHQLRGGQPTDEQRQHQAAAEQRSHYKQDQPMAP